MTPTGTQAIRWCAEHGSRAIGDALYCQGWRIGLSGDIDDPFTPCRIVDATVSWGEGPPYRNLTVERFGDASVRVSVKVPADTGEDIAEVQELSQLLALFVGEALQLRCLATNCGARPVGSNGFCDWHRQDIGVAPDFGGTDA